MEILKDCINMILEACAACLCVVIPMVIAKVAMKWLE